VPYAVIVVVEKVRVRRLKCVWMQCPLPAKDMQIALYNNFEISSLLSLCPPEACYLETCRGA